MNQQPIQRVVWMVEETTGRRPGVRGEDLSGSVQSDAHRRRGQGAPMAQRIPL